MYDKDFFASKTTWGMVIALVGPLLSRYFDIAPEGYAALTDSITTVVGGVMFLWGQFARKGEIVSIAGVKVK
jgi:hypothetical protein